MADFHPFAAAVKAQFDRMAAAGDLFVVDINGDALFDVYQTAFLPGTNEIYRERREHDCSCCKNFIRNVGNVVSIQNGELVTIWDKWGSLEQPYDIVAEQLHHVVRNAKITGVFRTTEPAYGAETSKELRDNGTVHTWNHFHAAMGRFYKGSEAAARRGEAAALFQVLNRGLIELKIEDVDTVIDLAQTNNLYRAAEKLHMLTAFRDLQQKHRDLLTKPGANSDNFVWANLASPAARLRNDVIGTLLQDLAEGVDLERAVKSYEDKVSGTNYKRPTALITPRMVEDALKTIQAEGLEPALERRFARIEDVAINDVLWADNSVKDLMKGGLADVLMAAATQPTKIDATKAEDIGIDDFLTKILPQAHSLDVVLRNSQQGNFMSVTAAVHDYADQPAIFKWANNFAWSYDGNIADSMKERVKAAGGNVEGDLCCRLAWEYADDLDFHMKEPTGGTIYFGNIRSKSVNGGMLDVDANGRDGPREHPVENIFYASRKTMREGVYKLSVNNYDRRSNGRGFEVEIEADGQMHYMQFDSVLGDGQTRQVAEITYHKGEFDVKCLLPATAGAAKGIEKWGITTETPAKVNTVMFSPNYWGDQAVGHRHVFFILDGCKNNAPARGFYNEFLRNDLDKHRKVFETLGDKTKCQPTDNQLSGVGFTIGRGDKVLVQVTGQKLRKTYNVKF